MIALAHAPLPIAALCTRSRARRRTSGVPRAVAAQPPGDHDESFGRAVPYLRGEFVGLDESSSTPHVVRAHHAMGASTFFAPSLSLLGPGALRRLGPIIAATGAKTALVITGDRTFDVTGVIPELRAVLLEDAGLKVEIFDEVTQNPTTQQVRAATIMAEEIDADCIVSVGGGSCHDAAKLVRALYRNGAGQTSVEELEGVDNVRGAP